MARRFFRLLLPCLVLFSILFTSSAHARPARWKKAHWPKTLKGSIVYTFSQSGKDEQPSYTETRLIKLTLKSNLSFKQEDISSGPYYSYAHYRILEAPFVASGEKSWSDDMRDCSHSASGKMHIIGFMDNVPQNALFLQMLKKSKRCDLYLMPNLDQFKVRMTEVDGCLDPIEQYTYDETIVEGLLPGIKTDKCKFSFKGKKLVLTISVKKKMPSGPFPQEATLEGKLTGVAGKK